MEKGKSANEMLPAGLRDSFLAALSGNHCFQLSPSSVTMFGQKERPYQGYISITVAAYIQYPVDSGRGRKAPVPFSRGRTMLKTILDQLHCSSTSSLANPASLTLTGVVPYSTHRYISMQISVSISVSQEILPTKTKLTKSENGNIPY